jgi:hypothetical protein
MRWGWPPAFRILIQSLRPVMLAVYMAQRLCNLGHCLVSRVAGLVVFGPISTCTVSAFIRHVPVYSKNEIEEIHSRGRTGCV